jgi:hypothetical protein
MSASNLSVACFPRANSKAHFGSAISGVSMSAMRIFWPLIQMVSPSTTHAFRVPVAQLRNTGSAWFFILLERASTVVDMAIAGIANLAINEIILTSPANFPVLPTFVSNFM